MGLFSFLKQRTSGQDPARADRGLLLFENTSEVIRAEKILRAAGFAVAVKGPPPEVRTGCDLAVEYPLIEGLNILRRLEEAKVPPLDAIPVTGPLLTPVDLYHVKDFGDHLMVRAANMKITVDKRTGVIVNVSGGGCPDVPWLAARLIGQRLDEAPSPRETGHTLCGYALGLAFEEMKRQCLPS
ncbi:DUF3343 domain-containing protein [Pseudodesulfovibrio sp. F-1]|uniref:DUF3343 domain-containing protein n=1 Tax=Pseudodesulfovibrio alkaliphilus TaxID=2661613 RepID=A0A7K1KN93_9BACT|nr:DUF3343 domain-containing protein [Pseudodesulfovibrio alkaliphilus]MUM77362.1 DUF3343 domain-containing protein [Pseudodesulfovibrio alkaliphilus]